MRHILDAVHVEVLRRYAGSNVLLGFDYDGTLAPLVADPDAAHMRPGTRALLAQVTRLYRCAVVSGRAQADVLRRLRGVGTIEAIGNHGLEPSRYSPAFARRVESWLPALEARLLGVGLEGLVIENKVFSLAIHYRRCGERRRARQEVARAVGALDGARVIGGKMVFNVVPAGAPHKGTALLAARDRFCCQTALYIGDDDTDEDVFALDEPGRLLGIRVEPKRSSRAAYFIRGQDEIDTLLQALVSFRAS